MRGKRERQRKSRGNSACFRSCCGREMGVYQIGPELLQNVVEFFHAVSGRSIEAGIRSEERRVGKEGRSRWPPHHLKKSCVAPTQITAGPRSASWHIVTWSRRSTW